MKRRQTKVPSTSDNPVRNLPRCSVVLDRIELTDDSNDNEDIIILPTTSAAANVTIGDDDDNDSEEDEDVIIKPTTSTAATANANVPLVDLTESDPTLISTLVKEHCIFCLTKKTRTIFSIGSPTCTEEIDGYELLRRYFGNATSDCLNDIFDAVVFTNKLLITAEFPAPLLCKECVLIFQELDMLHKKLDAVQRQILLRVRKVRRLVVDNGSFIKTQKGPSENRLKLENDVLEDCKGSQETAEVVLGFLDNFQNILEEDTHDKVEIHLEHLEQLDAFSSNDDEDVNLTDDQHQSLNSAKLVITTSTQTDNDFNRYNIKIIKLSEDEGSDDGDKDNAPVSPTSDSFGDGHDYDDLPLLSPQEALTCDDVKPEVPLYETQPMSVDADDAVSELENPSSVGQISEAGSNEDGSTDSSDSEDMLGSSKVLVKGTSGSIPPVGQEEPVATASFRGNISLPVATMQPTDDGILIVRGFGPQSSGITIVKNKVSTEQATLNSSKEDLQPQNQTERLESDQFENQVESEQESEIEVVENVANNKSLKRIKASEKKKVRTNRGKQVKKPTGRKRKKSISDESESDSSSSESESNSSSDSIHSTDSSDKSDSSQTDCSDSDDDENKKKKTKRTTRKKTKLIKEENQDCSLNRNKPFKCALCKRHFAVRYDVYRHMRDIHHREPVKASTAKYACTECHFECYGTSQIKSHMKKTHNMKLSHPLQLNTRTYECATCGYSQYKLKLFGFIDHLRNHESLAMKNFSCEDCQQKFTTKQMYQLHPCPQTGQLPGIELYKNLENMRKEFEHNCRFCPVGKEKFPSERSLQNHFEAEHIGSKPFHCSTCRGDADVAFESKNELKTHMIETHGAIKYKCRICENGEEEFAKFNDLLQHMNVAHFGGYFICPECSRKFNDKNKFDEHVVSHSNEVWEVCNICEFRLKTKEGLQRHMQKLHGEDEGENANEERTQLDEDETGKSNNQRVYFKKSRQCNYRPSTKNGGVKPYNCNLCDYDCCAFKLYRAHMQNSHGIMVDRKVNSRMYKCESCDYTNSSVRSRGFLQHLKEHETSIKRFTCVDCFDLFSTRQMYEYHTCPQTGRLPGTATVHIIDVNKYEKDNYTCRFCGTEFTSEKAVQTHSLREHRENAFLCEICVPGTPFATKDLLKSHKMVTHGAVPYKCRLCNPIKEFTKFHAIFTHTNIEHFDCFYKCPHCDRRFAEKLKLTNHIASHSDAKNHICNVCGAGLKTIGTLRRHIQAYHTEGVKKHMCEYCSREFLEKSNLRKHIESQHTKKVKQETEKAEEETPKKRARKQRSSKKAKN